MNEDINRQSGYPSAVSAPIELEVVIEIPRGSFLKRGSDGHVDFISPFPCPFNYGAVPQFLGQEGDLLDALVLGPRLPLGSRRRVKAWGAVILMDRGMTDDKLVCSDTSPSATERERILRFFHFYAKCKGILNLWRRRPGLNQCQVVRSRPCARSRPTARRGVDGACSQVLNLTGHGSRKWFSAKSGGR